jgi:hypothetical protein
MTIIHQHDWFTVLSNAVASYSKRDCPDDKVLFEGSVQHCTGCRELRFVCADQRLTPVELEL